MKLLIRHLLILSCFLQFFDADFVSAQNNKEKDVDAEFARMLAGQDSGRPDLQMDEAGVPVEQVIEIGKPADFIDVKDLALKGPPVAVQLTNEMFKKYGEKTRDTATWWVRFKVFAKQNARQMLGTMLFFTIIYTAFAPSVAEWWARQMRQIDPDFSYEPLKYEGPKYPEISTKKPNLRNLDKHIEKQMKAQQKYLEESMRYNMEYTMKGLQHRLLSFMAPHHTYSSAAMASARFGFFYFLIVNKGFGGGTYLARWILYTPNYVAAWTFDNAYDLLKGEKQPAVAKDQKSVKG